jgi:hypothetical protein
MIMMKSRDDVARDISIRQLIADDRDKANSIY